MKFDNSIFEMVNAYISLNRNFPKMERRRFQRYLAYQFYMNVEELDVSDLKKKARKELLTYRVYEQYVDIKLFGRILDVGVMNPGATRIEIIEKLRKLELKEQEKAREARLNEPCEPSLMLKRLVDLCVAQPLNWVSEAIV